MRSVASILVVLFVAVLVLWLVTSALDLGGNFITLLLLAAPVAAVFFILASRRNTA